MAGRGELTDKIGMKMYEFGVPANQKMLRLIPYIHDCIINNNCIDPNKVDAEERKILSWLRQGRMISGGASEVVRCSQKFWTFMSEILWLGYADYENH